MKLNSSNMTFLSMLILTTTMTMSSNNILMMWMAMEMNLISFMPILTKSKKMKDFSMKYLIIQSTASSLLLMSILINLTIECPINESVILMISMLMKLGMMPFHLWMPTLMSSSSWNTCMLMMTIQKLIPVSITLQMIQVKMMLTPMIISMIMAPMVMMVQTSTKKIMAYSSISNTPMMLMSMMNSKFQFLMFMSSYSVITLSITNLMKKLNLIHINQMNSQSKWIKLMTMVNMLSMSGMPPMLGFFMKWIVIQLSMKMSMLLTTSIILSSIISTYAYLNMIIPTMSTFSTNKLTKKSLKSEEFLTMINTTGLPLMMILKLN
uniref:NADH dehydrogenase subunit 2 n=1 Tax=Tenguna kuankuoshuiensis TaxID=3054878 RepID=UPI0026E1EA5C|nr:NADH dehydrogenase subunit 2 [Tenguna kuankuoshuiensis]WJE88872.1 NADH dehydrogenase subunit 2 [Tenguna kuankuoshuiensis]